MKNIKKISLIFVLFLSVISCTKEIEFGSDFAFKINNVNNNTVYLNTLKDFEIEVYSLINVDKNKTFSLSYRVESGALDLIDNNVTLIGDTDYAYTLNEDNKILLQLKPKASGTIKVTITLTDNNGVAHNSHFLVICMNQDFTFTANAGTADPSVGTSPTINFNIQNLTTSSDSYTMSYTTNNNGVLVFNGQPIQQGVSFPISANLTSATYTGTTIGSHIVEFTVRNSTNIVKVVQITFNFTTSPFTVNVIPNLTTKNGLKTPFVVTIDNYNANQVYSIKVKSNLLSKFYTLSNGTYTEVISNIFNTANISSNGLINLYFAPLQNDDDVITITVKDANGIQKQAVISASVRDKPTAAGNIKPDPFLGSYLQLMFANCRAYDGSTIVSYEFRVWSFTAHVFRTFSGNYPTPFSVTAPNAEQYLNQTFYLKVLDSDGVWSDEYVGTCHY